MSDNYNFYYEQIDDFLRGHLAPEAHEAFEKAMESIPELKEDVLISKDLMSSLDKNNWNTDHYNSKSPEVIALRNKLRTEEYTALANTITNVGNDYLNQEQKLTKKRFWLYPSGIAAAIVILIGSYFFLKPTNLGDQYENYANWESLPSIIEKSDANESILLQLERDYLDRNFDRIISVSENIYLLNTSERAFALQYLGAAYFETSQYQKAIKTFNDLTQLNSLEFSKGYWYNLLIYLKTNDKVNALSLSKTITKDSNNYNYKKALEIKNKLE